MFDNKQLDKLAQKLYAALPPSLQHFEKDIQEKFKEILQATFIRLNLVTREEFEVQTKVLARTREKVDAMAIQLDAALKKLKNKPGKKK